MRKTRRSTNTIINTLSSGLVIKDIPGYPGYRADSEGHIWGVLGHRLKWQYNKGGYPRVTIGHNIKQTVHKLVCIAFHGSRPSGCEIRHLDTDKNNSRPDNLKYGTPRENADDTIKYSTIQGSKNGNSKLKEADVVEMRELYHNRKMNQTELAKKYGVSQSCIFYTLEGKRVWKHVPNPCKVGTHPNSYGSKAHRAKLNEQKVIVIRERIKAGESDLDIAKDYEVTSSAIWHIRHRYTYEHTSNK